MIYCKPLDGGCDYIEDTFFVCSESYENIVTMPCSLCGSMNKRARRIVRINSYFTRKVMATFVNICPACFTKLLDERYRAKKIAIQLAKVIFYEK